MTAGQDNSFERRMRRLQDIVQELERTDLPLEQSVILYKEGRALARACGEMLERARHEISLSGEDGVLQPFVPAHDGDGTDSQGNAEERICSK